MSVNNNPFYALGGYYTHMGGIAGLNKNKINSCYCVIDITSKSKVFGKYNGITGNLGKVMNSFVSAKINLISGEFDILSVDNSGITNKCLIDKNSMIIVSEEDISEEFFNTKQYENVMELEQIILKKELVNKLYWDENIWIIDEINYPKLKWEN